MSKKRVPLIPWLIKNQPGIEKLLNTDKTETEDLLAVLQHTVNCESEARYAGDRMLDKQVTSNYATLLEVARVLEDLKAMISMTAGSTGTALDQIKKICRHKYHVVIDKEVQTDNTGTRQYLNWKCLVCGHTKPLHAGLIQRVFLRLSGFKL
jgi:hypothetical protein